MTGNGWAQGAPAGSQLWQPEDPLKELAMKIKTPFTIAIAGDLNYVHPVNQLTDPSIQAALKIIRNADAAMGNMEAGIADIRNYKGVIAGGMADKDIAKDVKDIGFDIVTRAGNRAFDGGVGQMFETNRLLDEAGVKYAGVGRDLQEARAAQYADLPKGRVGMVGMYSLASSGGGGGNKATERLGIYDGAPGQNVLGLTQFQIVNQQQFDYLKKIREDAYAHLGEYDNAVPPIDPNERKDAFQLFRTGPWLKVGNKPGGISYEMDKEDLREILRSIKNGKEYSDYMIATIHTHEDGTNLQLLFFDMHPTDFEVELAHKTIDAGADVFVAHGIHVNRGIEIYQGHPIFYGMSSFLYQLNQQVPSAGYYRAGRLNPMTTDRTDAELAWDQWDRKDRPRMIRENMDSFVAECKYDKAQLLEVVIHPSDLGFDLPWADQGTPRIPAPESAQRILKRMQQLSDPFGTKIDIQGNIGIIHVASSK